MTTEDAPNLASVIEHTLLKPEANDAELGRLCKEAIEHGFYGVCVASSHVARVTRHLLGTDVRRVSVVGFPSGAVSSVAKICEAKEAVLQGAQEIDMVINLGWLKSHEYQAVFEDVRGVVDACQGRVVKVILEMAKLTEQEKISGATLAKAAGAAFVKTCTGFGGGFAAVEDVALLAKVVGPNMGIKASGGIRDRANALRLLSAGANRLGASASLELVLNE